MELPFEFCENKNWLFYLIVYMRRTKNQQNKFLVIKFRLAGDWCAAGTYAIQGKACWSENNFVLLLLHDEDV